MQKWSDTYIARLLISACLFLYLLIFGALFIVATNNGANYDRFIGLNLPKVADTNEYIALSDTMMTAGRFAITATSAPEYARTPGYPAFLAGVKYLFGTFAVIPFIQFVLTALTVAMIYLIGVRYFPRSVALAAAVLYMLDPIVLYAAWIPITESVYMFFLIASIWAIGLRSRVQWLPYALGGVLLAISVYVRPIGLYAAPFIAAMALAHTASRRIALRHAAVFLVAAFVVVAPWMIRNYSLAGHFAFDSVRDWQFYSVNMPLFVQVMTGVGYQTTLEDNNERLFGTHDYLLLRSFEYNERQAAVTKAVIMEHPFKYTLFHAFKSLQYFVSSSIVNVQYHMYQLGILPGDHPQGEGAWGIITQGRYKDALVQTFTHIPRLLERIFLGIAYLLTFFSVYLALRGKVKNAAWIIVAFLLLNLFAVLIGPGSDDTRYRMPSEPFVFLLAAFAVHTLLKRYALFRQTKK